MCGIVGISVKKGAKDSNIYPATGVFKSLMYENTSRGKDSTGILYASDKDWEVYTGFLPGKDAQNFVLPELDTNTMLGHVRFATVGNKTDYLNVHPFTTGKFVGMHNGTIFNHKLLKSHFKLEPVGSCDSEIAFRILDKNRPDLINVITNGSKPMVFIKVHGKFIAFGSIAEETIPIVEKVYEEKNVKVIIEKIKPCTLYQLSDGKIQRRVDCSSFIPFISEEEGKLRYKLEYKGWKRDFYNMAIPLHRRLGAGKTVATPSKYASSFNSKTGQGNMFPTRTNWDTQPKSYDKADPKLKDWYGHTTKTLLNQFQNRVYDNKRGLQHSYFNIDTLGTLVNFNSEEMITKFVFQTIYGTDPSALLQNKKVLNPTVSIFPSEEKPLSIWLPAIGQMNVFLT